MQISSQHPGLMKPFKKTCSSVFPTAFLSVWVLEVSTCKLLCNFEQILSHTFVYLSCSYTFIYILSNSFDVFVFCACSQAFQPTLSRATEIASRSSLRSMKFILSRTQTGRKPARHSSSVLSGPSGTQRTEPWGRVDSNLSAPSAFVAHLFWLVFFLTCSCLCLFWFQVEESVLSLQ